MSRRSEVKKATRERKETILSATTGKEHEATTIRDFTGDEVLIYQVGHHVALGTMRKGTAKGFAVLLDAEKVDAVVAELLKAKGEAP